MTEMSRSQRVTVSCSEGLHARPADQFVRLAASFQSVIEIEKDGEMVDGKWYPIRFPEEAAEDAAEDPQLRTPS